mgnify:CR=1 FL=1
MAFKNLERFQLKRQAEAAIEEERETTRVLRRAVKAVLPKGIQVPVRPRGRPSTAGVGRREVAVLRAKATAFLLGEEGLRNLETEILHTALVIQLVDGLLGTEPWRTAGGRHGGMLAASARLRYLENAARLLDDLRRRRRDASGPRLLDGVMEAELAVGEGGANGEAANDEA